MHRTITPHTLFRKNCLAHTSLQKASYFRSIFRFTEEEAEVRKQVLAFVPAAISKLLKRFPSTEGFLWVKLLCEFFIKNAMSIFWKFCTFWALDIAPTLAVLGLLLTSSCWAWNYLEQYNFSLKNVFFLLRTFHIWFTENQKKIHRFVFLVEAIFLAQVDISIWYGEKKINWFDILHISTVNFFIISKEIFLNGTPQLWTIQVLKWCHFETFLKWLNFVYDCMQLYALKSGHC